MVVEKKLIEFANFLANEAAIITLEFYEKEIEISNKSSKGFDPVTEVDKKTELLLRDLIKKEFPNHGIIGEEFEDTYLEGEPHWIIDPIDGTRAFILDIPIWGTLIAYNDGSRSVLGVADLPALGKRFAGYNDKSYDISDGKETPIFANKDIELEDCVISTTDPLLFSKEDYTSFEKLASLSSKRRFGLDCAGYCLLASGKIDLIIEPNLKNYDIQALIPIIEGSGGIITTWNNEKVYQGGNIIACSNKKLHSRAIRIINDSKEH